MKRIVSLLKKTVPLLALFLLFNSCTPESSGPNYLFELLPVESVDIPTEFTLGNTYDITMHYKLPSTCHYFNTFYYQKGNGTENNVRTIAVEAAVVQKNDCQPLTDVMETYTIHFSATENVSGGTYKFKFWQGEDTNGNNIFLEYEVPVN